MKIHPRVAFNQSLYYTIFSSENTWVLVVVVLFVIVFLSGHSLPLFHPHPYPKRKIKVKTEDRDKKKNALNHHISRVVIHELNNFDRQHRN